VLIDEVPEVLPPAPAVFLAPAPEPFADFYRREYPRLRVLARALVGAAAADDVAQEAMLVAYDRWATVATYQSPAAWVRCVCARKAVSVGRRRQAERRVLGRLALLRPPGAEQSHDGDGFWALVRRLPPRQAQVVALHYALDLPVAEVARTLGCAEGTVKVHLSRARAALSVVLHEEDPS
jgi:RNA polymerase sigma-70 factor (ECF subfamily)